MKKLEIKIEDGIEKPDYTGKNILTGETMKSLRDMKAGQSFTVKTESHKLTVQLYGRKIGKVFSSRKIYEGNTKGKNTPYHFRIWCESGKAKPLPSSKPPSENPKLKSFGSISKTQVSDDGDGDATTRHRVSDDVLAMAELRADNKRIVEDLDKIKQILKEELKHDMETFKPLNEDASNWNQF